MFAAFHIDRIHAGDAVVAVVALAAGRRIAFAQLVHESRVVHERPSHLHQFEPAVQSPLDSFAAHQTSHVN